MTRFSLARFLFARFPFARFRSPRVHLAGLLLLAALLLAPGSGGTFIFDDFGNLQGLAEVDRKSEALSFVLDSRSGPLGRPVSMSSFWLQSACWPDSPSCFKAFNLGLHLFNGLLLYFVIVGIARLARRDDANVNVIALCVTAVWLLHPIHASTVFYVVQRMNLLAGTFMLLGLLAYLRARLALQSENRFPLLHAWLLFPLALALAAFSKENGLLLVAYVAVIEFVLPPTQGNRAHGLWRLAIVIAPVVLVAIALIVKWDSLVLQGYANRLFTFEERSLTQLRVLVDYLLAIVAPNGSRIGLFHEDYPLSGGLFQPASTAASLAFLLALTAACMTFLRRRFPLLALGWLWFLAGHAMESSVFPLEVYFEHRNYLPAAGVLLAVAAAAALVPRHMQSPLLRKVMMLVFAGYIGYVGLLAHLEAQLWGDPIRQAVVWAEENPQSPRSQIYFNNALFALGKQEEAVAHFEQMAVRLDNPLIAWMSWLQARCSFPEIKEPPYQRMKAALRKAPLHIGPTNGLNGIVLAKLDGECKAVSPGILRDLATALLQNPAFNSKQRQLNITMARIDALDHDFRSAIARIEAVYRIAPAADLALQIAGWHVNLGDPASAREWLQQARADHQQHPANYRGFEEDLAYLEKRLALLIEKQE